MLTSWLEHIVQSSHSMTVSGIAGYLRHPWYFDICEAAILSLSVGGPPVSVPSGSPFPYQETASTWRPIFFLTSMMRPVSNNRQVGCKLIVYDALCSPQVSIRCHYQWKKTPQPSLWKSMIAETMAFESNCVPRIKALCWNSA